MRLPNFIIAGTEKAGTTSVYSYLARHPSVAVSMRKETDFFRRASCSQSYYALEFPRVDTETILMEASPAYLGEAALVAPRMQAMLPHVRLLFILRDPVDRFVSSYHFHRERLNLPKNLGFLEYLHRSIDYANSQAPQRSRPQAADEIPIDEWYLKVLMYGRYSHYLRYYFAQFPRRQIRVTFFDDLRNDPQHYMQELSEFLDIDPDFWTSFSFEPMNASFGGRRKWLHKLALRTNDRLEPLLRQQPELKRALLGLYKGINQAAVGDRTLAVADCKLLEDYYAPANADLEALLGTTLPEGWARPPSSSRPVSNIRPVAETEVGR